MRSARIALLAVCPFVAIACANGVEDTHGSGSDAGAQGGTGGLKDGGWQDGPVGGTKGDGASCFPAKEICDGIDNDCDGIVDDQGKVPSSLCAVSQGTGKCTGVSGCVVATCSADYYDVDADFSNGCECQASPSPATTGSSCASAIDVGELSDAAATTVTHQGNVPFAGREIWYAFKATDDVDTAGDKFHVDVRFLKNPGDAYKMDVYRGGCPGAGVDKIATAEGTDTDWYVDFDKNATSVTCTTSPGCGEGNCKPSSQPSDAWNECGDDSAEFRVRIFSAGAPSCATFDLELSNGKY